MQQVNYIILLTEHSKYIYREANHANKYLFINYFSDQTINLKYFSQQILTSIRTSEVCWVPCASFSSDNPRNFKYYKSNRCNGWVDECRYFTGPRDMGEARFCLVGKILFYLYN